MIFTIVGMPGSGKTCMGRTVSKKLKIKWMDSDKIIQRTYDKRLVEIISMYGVEEFKRIENETLLRISADSDAILSTGGSAVYYPEAMERLKKLGKIIYLHCDYNTVVKRLGDFSERGIVLAPGQSLRDLYDERCALYEKYADFVIDCSGNAFPQYQAKVISAIKESLNP